MASPLALLRLHAASFLPPSTAHLFARRHPSLLPVLSALSSASLTLNPAVHLAASYPYGPSLRKGLPRPPCPPAGGDDDGAVDHPAVALDRERFVRVFEVAALRVPAAVCAALEGRLRGHLLNWPRVRNVARVPGDEVDPEVAGLLREGGGGGREDRLEPALRRAREDGDREGDGEVPALSPVLYREKLVKEFNCRGFVRFRNLAKMSRPKKKKRNRGKEEEDEEREGDMARSRRGKSDFSIVEVARCCSEEDKEEGLGRLLGDDFARGRWTGPTRLLLLDERYANKGLEELPEAVKVA